MVTGIETAGIVLGSIPLLIAALENYENVVRPTREFFSWRKYRRKLIQELYTLRVSYDLAIHILLKPVADINDIAMMVDDPLCNLWTTGPIANSLRDKLGLVYDPLILTMGEIAEILGGIAANLSIQGSQQETVQLKTLVVEDRIAKTQPLLKNPELAKRIIFTMRKSCIKSSLERLEVCTRRLDSWIEKVGKVYDEPAPSRSKSHFTASLGAIQSNASRMYRALLQSRCKRKSQHPTLLLLEQRLKRQPRRTEKHSVFNVATESTCFKLSFDGECRQPWQFSTEFRIVESTPKSRVRITLPTEECSPYSDPSNLQQITDLCEYLRQPTHKSAGFCIDDTGILRVYPSLDTTTQCEDCCLTLESILSKLQMKLPLEELYCLVITLVASVFQLGHTPWLARRWSKKDIAFLRASTRPYLSVDIRYPYLVKDFVKISGLNDQPIAADDCSTLLALAILLLEISFGQSIEQIRNQQDLGNKGSADNETDLQTADRWYKAERHRLSQGFSQAILTCLQEFLNPDANLDDPDYCNSIKEKTLQPLEDEMQCMVFGPLHR